MTTKKGAQVVAAIKGLYSYYGRDTAPDVLVGLWVALMKEYSDDEVSFGLTEAMKVCKTPPTPADVIAEIKKAQSAKDARTDGELWVAYTAAVRKAYNFTEDMRGTYVHPNGMSDREIAYLNLQNLFDGLPQEVKDYVGGLPGLMQKARQYAHSDLGYEEGRFRKSMPELRELARSREKAQRMEEYLLQSAERRKLNG